MKMSRDDMNSDITAFRLAAKRNCLQGDTLTDLLNGFSRRISPLKPNSQGPNSNVHSGFPNVKHAKRRNYSW